ncbi:lipoyl synthase [Hydrogenimonas thermophila]|uniref:Lipoyl synthase n=1 Tax=Hydrogenimonas thermophila TaxID=223786 RepID=A0A1I5QIB2_9BACT|nr:lipoyl synthase [Hydrogenimonas thermophila]SFP45780.1 lipoic acid synthetase [Hydrogenimonas thermophila]
MRPYKPKVKAPDPELILKTDHILQQNSVTTVCKESACPNRAECYQRGTATFMILGDTCTRACSFCNVKTGRGLPPDPTEPERIATTIKELELSYVVITSVDRDDLPDYGAKHFESVVLSIRAIVSDVKIELLTPDFKADESALERIIECSVDKLAHNEETVRRLSPSIRSQSNYDRSLQVLKYYSTNFSGPVKSSLMVGLGESKKELIETMKDLLEAGVEELTIGQYLQPSSSHHPVICYYPPEFFEEMETKAVEMGFKAVASGTLVRSSYYADRQSY